MSDTLLKRMTPTEVREQLQVLVVAELLGPAGGEHEQLQERPQDRYLVGMLAPRNQRRGGDAGEVPEDPSGLSVAHGDEDDGEGETDQGVNVQASLMPSAIGCTFTVAPDAGPLVVTVRYGQYVREHAAVVENAPDTGKLVWQRIPRLHREVLPTLAEGAIGPIPLVPPGAVEPAAHLQGVVRRGPSGIFVSLFLVNVQSEPPKNVATAWLFQPRLEVCARDGGSPFVARSLETRHDEPPEERELAMRYRHRPGFAIGHGVAVHVIPDRHDPLRAVAIETRVVPVHEVRATEAADATTVEGLGDLTLDMQVLGEAKDHQLEAMLMPLVVAYRRWIDREQARLDARADGLDRFGPEGQRTLEACREACARIHGGIRLLTTDPDAASAFRFANLAMARQRVQALWGEARRTDPGAESASFDVPSNRSWRLFQLAFVLLNLESLTRLDHPDRSEGADAVADLLWFPTGGGKTEAYLGLTAYTLAIRRLQGEVAGHAGHGGVAVLMRYTLRLLTIQQFQRATALICACEMLRQTWLPDEPRWGTEPFRIGLWVGRKTTPNRTDQAVEALERARGTNGSTGPSSPLQLSHCPWCGSPIEPGRDVHARAHKTDAIRTYTNCGDRDGLCPFSMTRSPDEGLPVVVVDEEIYRLLPALVIATVDKFAQMPWNGAIQTLFGRVSGRCTRHGYQSPGLHETCTSHPASRGEKAVRVEPVLPFRPPDLIIQDELHLISGPLGSLTGLYETAVDALCTWTVGGRRVRPRVIASTATVRQASEQIRALFLRTVKVFPPQGLDVGDSFFAVEVDTTQRPGRRYLGICAPGRRLKHALIRVYLAHLAAATAMWDRVGSLADPYMTLVGYFGSLRELAGTIRLLEDDISTRIRRMDARGLGKRPWIRFAELTSRIQAGDIKKLLARLGRPFEPERYVKSEGSKSQGDVALDALLATNMISVGVDVPRLGLMVVTGQPKNTSEYIQATSRVGRQSPGLVCTVYNWSRPRDLSHYEDFEHYHETFYRHVEALSVTPFAPRALDRGLAALLVSLVRLTGTELSGNDGAGKLPDPSSEIDAAIEAIAMRAGEVEGRTAVRDEVKEKLKALADRWKATRRLAGGVPLGYERSVRAGEVGMLGLLHRAEDGSRAEFTCPGSLRDVETAVPLLLVEKAWEGLVNEPPFGGKPA
jgi:hypothetical protein